jgi:phosphoglycerate dehydrogenase-like enzyme
MPDLSDAQLARLPKLEAVFYAAGNVKAFAQRLVDRDIVLVSAWAINAIPVAERCLSQILLSLRGYFRTVRAYRERRAQDDARKRALFERLREGATFINTGRGRAGG